MIHSRKDDFLNRRGKSVHEGKAVLRDVPDLPPLTIRRRRNPVDENLALLWRQLVENELHERTLPRPVAADNRGAFPLFNGKRHVVENGVAVVAKRQVFDVEMHDVST